MTAALSAPDLANTVTGFCTIAAGVVPLVLCRHLAPQPRRWLLAYAAIVLTGIPTVGFHGWGGSFWRVADTGTNLLLAFTLQCAALGDFHAPRFRLRFVAISALANLFAVGWMIREEVLGAKSYAIPLGGFGGFYLGEAVLIADSFAVAALLYRARREIPERARPLLHAVTASFLVGLVLASAGNETLVGRIGSLHALWHVVGAFGFILFWGFNHARFTAVEAPAAAQRAMR